jgi:hypothetical protein
VITRLACVILHAIADHYNVDEQTTMNPHAARKPSLYEQLMALPEGLTGEIINGQLRTQPRPAWPHILAGSRLGTDIEAYELADTKWRPLAIFRDDDTVCVAPFDKIVIHLADLWS